MVYDDIAKVWDTEEMVMERCSQDSKTARRVNTERWKVVNLVGKKVRESQPKCKCISFADLGDDQLTQTGTIRSAPYVSSLSTQVRSSSKALVLVTASFFERRLRITTRSLSS